VPRPTTPVLYLLSTIVAKYEEDGSSVPDDESGSQKKIGKLEPQMCIGFYYLMWDVAVSQGLGRSRGDRQENNKLDLASEKVMEQMTRAIATRLKEQISCPNCATILVVDDNEFNRFLLVQLLNKYGFVCKMVLYCRIDPTGV
jgi:hypothetical protein